MTASSIQKQELPAISLPAIPVLCVNTRHAVLLTVDGELQTLSHAQAKKQIYKKPVMVCHAPYTQKRLETETLLAFDLLELFAFVHPAVFCVPTPFGLAKTLGLTLPASFEDTPLTLAEAAQALLSDLQKEPRAEKKASPLEIARAMGKNGQGWPWTPFVCQALGEEYDPALPVMGKVALNIWKYMPEWSEQAPPSPPAHDPVTEEESRARLAEILGDDAEIRGQQRDYAAKMTAAFAPLGIGETEEGQSFPPHIVLAEAGTGVGKTLGYLAPASVWAEKNKGTVWISTYTKNLQRQIDQELDRLFPHPDVKNAKITIRKGRENYLCLLNMEDIVAGAALAKNSDQIVAAGIMARWAEASRNGDLQGGDFPGWLTGLLGWQYTLGLADKRGECIYSACDHYHRCFVERTVRKAQHAEIVVANHALVMVKAASASLDDPLPQRYVFDEAHHLFDAADSAFAGHLTARETHDLRRWIKGAEGGRQSRARGLKRRAEDLVAGDAEGEAELEAILHNARILPAFGWSRRMRDKAQQGETEAFLALVYAQVFNRAKGQNDSYSLETQTQPLIDGLGTAALALKSKLRALQKPMRSLSKRLKKRLSDQAETLDSDTRKRLDSVANSLDRRAEQMLAGWIAMLETLVEEIPESPGTTKPLLQDKNFVDWMEIERIDGKAVDIGLYRHWVDPMLPFTKSILPFAHGIAMTSATLRDSTQDDAENWRVARERTGVDYLTDAPVQFAEKSPFDYAGQTRIFIINDVNKNNLDQVAAATRELFKAAGGGALGLFTAIQRLRAVHNRIIQPLEEAGLSLYAQHMDDIDTGTLVDIFREEIHACLLGTDAVRDGIDVPGESLRLLVYDRVPWPRPSLLHKARREAFGGRRYDELMTRLKLRQAYGRLIRRSTDKGVFVMLDNAMPSRLCDAFPENVEIIRQGLADTIPAIQDFLKNA
ncbi:MAG: ATP-dependent DNA helicase [Alphaproteobacteria bacterium CG_4_9_14_3_um_filter_47_13]|nr:MAG: ATP-dependent DNA helicase [Alphaproteobacteria bacterium CG_4_9_14_3_um_filter_47_13]